MKEKIQHILNATWFEVEEVLYNKIALSTRDNGNVGEERAGTEDIAEAKKIVNTIEKINGFEAEYYVCDEWVKVSIKNVNI